MALKVLIVDDDFINQKLLYSLLKKSPAVTGILEAKNGSDALDMLKKNPDITLILLDILMPVMTGIEFLKIFRSNRGNAHIPVIVLSTDDTRKTEVMGHGANDFLAKPVREDKLFAKIAQWS